ncbi:MAG: hypothetical protein LBQ87_08925 [Candidatus Fibromonas sp.]|jgi:hypothetical protein|nr:hypothetical protein [Candidatus Fibromonas sp.]
MASEKEIEKMKKAILVLSVAAFIICACKEKPEKPTVVNKVYKTANNDSISISKKEITDAKGLALCYCFVFMNEKDSLSIMNKDVSGSYFTEYSTLSIDQMNGIRDFVRQNIGSFFAVPWQVGHNMITYTCWSFYESDELDLFVKELLREEQ